MPKRIISYQPWLQDRLKDPNVAAAYLKGVLRDSPDLFPKALRKVADAQGIALSKIAETAGVERESVYRMLSGTGNPTWLSLRGIVQALAFEWDIKPASKQNKRDFKRRAYLDYAAGWANSNANRTNDRPDLGLDVWHMFVGQHVTNPTIVRYANAAGNNSNANDAMLSVPNQPVGQWPWLREYANQNA